MKLTEKTKRDQRVLKQVQAIENKLQLSLGLDIINNLRLEVRGLIIRQPDKLVIRGLQILVAQGAINPEELRMYEGRNRINFLSDGGLSRDIESNFFTVESELLGKIFFNS